MQPTRITVLVVFHAGSAIALVTLGGCLGRAQFGLAGMLAGIIIGFFVGHALGALASVLASRWMFRTLSRASSPDLWAELNDADEWNFHHTTVLLQLAARGENVAPQLPRILLLLEADAAVTRRYGWDALRLVFTDVAERAGSFDPGAPPDECRAQVAQLRRAMA